MLRELGLLQAPIVTTFHGYDMSEYVRRRGPGCYRRLLAAGDLFLPVSDRWRARLIDMGADPTRVRVHRMGVDCRRIVPRSAPIPRAPRRVLSVARLVEKKGIEFGIRAFAVLSRARPDVNYLVIGDGELRSRLERLAVTLGVGGRVQFAGLEPHGSVVRALQEADVFLAPSVTAASGDEEGISVAVMEAMAAGLPVVATRHSGTPELLLDGETGFLAEERDVPGLAAALCYLLENPEQRTAMGLKGRARILAEYNAESQNDRLAAILQRVVVERSRAA
jgi:colanic acid/amylovoran biosynthesis glycosyltransferase